MNIKVTYHIFEARSRRKLTISQLSELSGVSRGQINNIENGNKDATVTTLCKIGVAMGIHPCKLFTFKVIK